MNTIQCPVCKQELEGDFQMTDTVKCPACETAFIPANVLARRKEPIVLKSRGAEDSHSFAKKEAGIQDSAPSSRDESCEKSSQGTNHEARNERPKQIVWTVATWIGALVFRNIVLFCFVVAALTTGDNAFFESEIALYFTSCFVVLPVSVVVAWHLYKGKQWAKVLYSVFVVFSLLTVPIYHFGTKAMSMNSMVRNHITFLPNWVLNIGVLWGVIVLVVFICGLRWVNQKESRAWLKSKKGSPNNTPWWIWAVLFNLLSIVALIVTFKSFMGVDSKDRLERTEQTSKVKPARAEEREQTRREATEGSSLSQHEAAKQKSREERKSAVLDIRSIANNGKEIVVSILGTNIDREANLRADLWPDPGKWKNSNEYFAQLMGAGGKKELYNVSMSMFSGGGMAAAADADELQTSGNIWSCLAGIRSCDDHMPFIWSSNLVLSPEDFVRRNSEDDWEDWSGKIDSTRPPYTRDVILVRKGGAFQIIKAEDLGDWSFLWDTGVEDPSQIQILEPAHE